MEMSLEDMGWWYEMIALTASRNYLEERMHAEEWIDVGGES